LVHKALRLCVGSGKISGPRIYARLFLKERQTLTGARVLWAWLRLLQEPATFRVKLEKRNMRSSAHTPGPCARTVIRRACRRQGAGRDDLTGLGGFTDLSSARCDAIPWHDRKNTDPRCGPHRRLELLDQAGIAPDRLKREILDETPQPFRTSALARTRLSRGGAGQTRIDPAWKDAHILAADTVVSRRSPHLAQGRRTTKGSPNASYLLSGPQSSGFSPGICWYARSHYRRKNCPETRVRFKRLSKWIEAISHPGEWRGGRCYASGLAELTVVQACRLLHQCRRPAAL